MLTWSRPTKSDCNNESILRWRVTSRRADVPGSYAISEVSALLRAGGDRRPWISGSYRDVQRVRRTASPARGIANRHNEREEIAVRLKYTCSLDLDFKMSHATYYTTRQPRKTEGFVGSSVR